MFTTVNLTHLLIAYIGVYGTTTQRICGTMLDVLHMKQKIPTTIFSGFLGSGKTTIILHLVEKLQASGKQVVYIKNEIGDTDIDGQILHSKNIKTRELLNGCICCTLVGPFTTALTEVVETYHPARIFIEASGAADPSALALMVSSHPLLLRDGVVGIIDVLNFTGYADLTQTTKNQTTFIDLLIFNKIELADLAQKRRVVGYVRELNTHSPIIEAPNGHVAPEAVLGLESTELSKLLREYTHTNPEHTDHVVQDELSSFTLTFAGTIQKPQLLTFLQTLPNPLFRAKGIVQLDTDEWYVCNMVAGRADVQQLENTDQPPQENILICIGIHADEYKQEVTKLLHATLA